MIVGFPGETDADFEDTLSLTEQVGYHSMFSFKYSARPNTLAEQRLPDDVSEEEKTEADRGAAGAPAGHSDHAQRGAGRLRGRRCWWTPPAGGARRSSRGGRASNVVVNFPGPAEWIGRTMTVRIERAGAYSVWGRPVSAGDAAH